MLPASKPLVRVIVTAAFLLALSACTTPSPPPPEVSSVSPPAPAPPPAPEPVELPEPPSPELEPEPAAPEVTAARTPEIDPAAMPVIARLARQLRIAETEITVAQVAHAEWPNSCLGLAAEGEICAQMITPGYAVSLIANEQRYEFRTDANSRRIRLAFAPLPETGEALVTWKDSASFSVLVVGTESVAFGLRGQPRAMLVAPLAVPGRAKELVRMMSRFAPFYARTPAGEVTFRGVGTMNATLVEQRQIGEWARLVSREAEGGLTVRAADRAFVWRRVGGIAGFCDEVVVSRAGEAAAWPCRSDAKEPAAVVALDPAELELLYRWLDTLAPFTWEDDDGDAVADALTISVELAGQGTRSLSEPERERMVEFANGLVRRLVTETKR